MTFRTCILLIAAAAAGNAAPVVLYNGALGTNPVAQGWGFSALFGTPTETVSGGATNLTSDGITRAGYALGSPVSLDRTSGYSISFELQLGAEAHSSTDRAGLSVIVLGNDLRGIEIGFWANEVWVQNDGATKPPRFTHGEGAAFDTTQRAVYRLNVLGDFYTLLGNGATLTSGSLRNYSPEGFPYNVTNFLFVGDDTSSAGATSSFFNAVIGTPEPSTVVVGVFGMAMVWVGKRRVRVR